MEKPEWLTKGGLEYEHVVFEAVWKAIVQATHDPETNVAMLRSGEICNALTFLQALFLSTSDDVSSPTKLREWCNEYSKKLYRRTLEMRRQRAEGKPDPLGDVMNPSKVQ